MSLATDSIFIAALKSSEDIMQAIGGRLYGTAIPLPDEEADNVPVPYIIVTFDGLNNQTQTKDEKYEGCYDTVQIGVEVVGKSLAALHELTQNVRDAILSYFKENDTPIDEYTFTADAVQYDSLKPCFWQVLRYQCDVYNLTEENDEQNEG